MPIEVKMFFPSIIDYATNTSAKHSIKTATTKYSNLAEKTLIELLDSKVKEIPTTIKLIPITVGCL